MKPVTADKLFARFEANPPASRNAVARCQANLGFALPADYVQFLDQMNGGEGFVGKHYLMAWRIEDLIQFNKEYLDDELVPELLLFGSDGGGELFAFDTRSTPPAIVAVPAIVSLKDAIVIAPNFSLFLQHMYQADDLI